MDRTVLLLVKQVLLKATQQKQDALLLISIYLGNIPSKKKKEYAGLPIINIVWMTASNNISDFGIDQLKCLCLK